VLQQRGHPVAFAGVDGEGLVDPAEIVDLADENTGLASVMLANNETGAIQPVAEIAERAAARGVLTHTDAAQAVGKIPVNVDELGVDLMSIAGHKMYAPKGVGALYVRRGAPLAPLVHGGGQEGGLRPGTENVPYMVGLGEACAMAAENLREEEARQRALGEMLVRGLLDAGIDFRINALDAPRLPGVLSLGFRSLKAGDLLSGLIGAEVGASGGAACHSGKTEISGVLKAMNAPRDYAEGAIRLSWGRMTTKEDMRELIVRLRIVLDSLQ
jgi:cysteine desulfurase